MKKLLLALLLVSIFSVQAHAVEFKLKPYIGMPTDSERVVQSREGIEIQTQWEEFYLFGAMETGKIRFSGQRVGAVDLLGAGFGFEHKFNDKFSVFIDLGYYLPEVSAHSSFDGKSGVPGEGIEYYLEKNIGIKPNFQNYSVEYKGNIGGRIGGSYNKQFTEMFSLELYGAYRYLMLEEMLKGYQTNSMAGCWHYKSDRDFGEYQAGISFNIKF